MPKAKNAVSHSDAAPILAALGIELEPGQAQAVSLTLTLTGAISRGEDTEAVATCRALSLALVGCLVRHLGAVREVAIDTALKAILAGEAGLTDADKQWAEELKTRIAAELPKTPVAGRRTGTLIVSPVPSFTIPATEAAPVAVTA